MSDLIIGAAEETNKKEPVEMRIIAKPGEPLRVEFPYLMDKVVSYGFLKMAEKTLDAHYNQKPKIVQGSNRILNYVRNRKK